MPLIGIALAGLVASVAIVRPDGSAPQVLEVLALTMFVAILGWSGLDWRARGRLHRTFPLWLGFTLMATFEAPFDWSAYVIFNPDFRFLLPDVFPFSLAPRTVATVNYLVYGIVFLVPVIAGEAIGRRWGNGERVVARSAVAAFLVGIPWVVALETFALGFKLYAYTQTPSFPVLRSGSVTQYPLAIPLAMGVYFAVVTALWCRRDDHGRWLAERWSNHPAGVLATTTAVVCVLYAGSMLPFAAARVAGLVEHQSTPQPYAGVAPYDPDGQAGP